MKNVVEHFYRAAEAYPHHVAIVHGAEQVTYAELKARVRMRASYFRKHGLNSGDRVMVFIPMSIKLYEHVLALFHIGATAVFIDAWAGFGRLSQCARLSDSAAILGSGKLRMLKFFIPGVAAIPKFISGRTIKLPEDPNVEEVTSDHSALITFTTGSTGIPKAADRSHTFLNAQFEALKREIQPSPTDIELTTLPIVLFVNLGIGATSVIPSFKIAKPDTMDVEREFDWLRECRVSRITASPFYALKIAQYASENRLKLEELRQIFTGGAPVYPTEAELLMKAFPDASIHTVYGSTECEPISSISAQVLAGSSMEKGIAVGEIDRDVKVAILKRDLPKPHAGGNSISSLSESDGTVGEIAVSGPHVLGRYFRNEEAFAKNKFYDENGLLWHRTGDGGYLENGQLFLVGNIDRILEGDSLLSPLLIEAHLRRLGVEKATIIERNGKPLLIIEAPSISTEVKAYADEHHISTVIALKHIPRDPRHRSKVDYGKLEKTL